MRVLVVNPVGHSRWDELDRRIYESFASGGTSIEVMSLSRGPVSVETAEDYAEAESLVVELVKERHRGFNAVIVNCFLDPGVARLRRSLRKVIVGPAEASLSLARNLSDKLAVITVGGDEETLNLIRGRVKSLGFERLVISLRGIPLRVIDLEKDREATLRHVVREASEAVFEGAEVIVMGCTGLAGMAREVSDAVRVPVVDPAWSALKVVEALTMVVGGDE